MRQGIWKIKQQRNISNNTSNQVQYSKIRQNRVPKKFKLKKYIYIYIYIKKKILVFFQCTRQMH